VSCIRVDVVILSPTQGQYSTMEKLLATWWQKHHPLLLALLQLFLAVLLIAFRSSTTQGSLYNLSVSGKSTVAFIVQIIAAVLGIGNLYVLRCLAVHYARRRLVAAPMSFDSFAFWAYLSSGSFDFSLPPLFFTITLVVSILSFGPAALWAGAITPTPATRNCSLSAMGPRFSQATQNIWNVQFEFRESSAQVWNHLESCISDVIDGRFYTNCPVPSVNDNLVRSAISVVSSRNLSGSTTSTSTFDQSGYLSVGRSYGVGFGFGVTQTQQQHLTSLMVDGFSFHESGYEISVVCARNSSSGLYFRPRLLGNNNTIPNIFELAGFLRNSIEISPEVYPIATWQGPSYENLAAWAAVYNPETKTSFLTIAAGPGKYARFNQTECQLFFTPRVFLVSVNVTGRSVVRTPLHSSASSSAPQLEPSGVLVSNIIRSLNLLSRMKSSLYASEIGESLATGLQGFAATRGLSLANAVLPMLEGYLTEMAEGILATYADAQMALAKDTQELKVVESTCRAVKLGSDVYLWVVLGVNIAVVVLVLAGMVVIKSWKGLPSWDVRSVRDLVTAAMAARERTEGIVNLKLVVREGGWELEAKETKKGGSVGVESPMIECVGLNVSHTVARV